MNEDGPAYVYLLMALAVIGTPLWVTLNAMGIF